MATRETLPVDNEPYTKGYYMIWGVLSLAAVVYIAYLAFGSGSTPLIKISKISDNAPIAQQMSEQSKRIGSAITIATRAQSKSVTNANAIKTLEKRVQLLTWKLNDKIAGKSGATGVADLATGVSNSANDHLKQVMGSVRQGEGIIGTVIPAPSPLDTVKKVTTKVVKTIAIKNTPGIGDVVQKVTNSGGNIVGNSVDALGGVGSALKVAAVGAGLAKSASSALVGDGKKTDMEAVIKQASLSTPAETLPEKPIVQKSPFATMPLPVRKSYGVRLTSGQTVEALRLTWDLINEMNRPILKGLQTRFVEGPSTVGMPYKLIAGPMGSTQQAKNLCGKLLKQNIACDVTVFKGRKL